MVGIAQLSSSYLIVIQYSFLSMLVVPMKRKRSTVKRQTVEEKNAPTWNSRPIRSRQIYKENGKEMQCFLNFKPIGSNVSFPKEL